MKASQYARSHKEYKVNEIPVSIDVDYFDSSARTYAMLKIDVKPDNSMEALIRESFKMIISEAKKINAPRVELFGVGESNLVCVNCFIGGEERFDLDVMSSMACLFVAIAAPYCVNGIEGDTMKLNHSIKEFAAENNTFGKLNDYWQYYCSSMGR